MNAQIKIKGFKPFAPSEISWSATVLNYVNTATVTLPSRCRFNGVDQPVAGLIKEGTPIEVLAGYNGQLVSRFSGFIARVNASIPVTLECEGYNYQLRSITDFTRSYESTTLKDILTDLIKGTAIELSPRIPDVPLDRVEFVRASGYQVLDWLKDQCLLSVSFSGAVLYVGLSQASQSDEAALRLGWNTAEDSDLNFNTDRELSEVSITVESKKTDGTKTKTTAGTGAQSKTLKTFITSPAAQREIALQKQKEIAAKGYEGSIKAFLSPQILPGMTIQITDAQNPERSGAYYCTTVKGSYSPSGGRQTLELAYQL